MRKFIAAFIILFAVSCKGQGEKWVRYIADSAGNAIDTQNVTFYEDEIVLEAVGEWNWTRLESGPRHDDIFRYKILDQMQLPSDPRKTTYHLRTDNGTELNFSIYRVEKDRAAVNFGQLTYNTSVKEKPFHEQFDSAYVLKMIDDHWQSPWFYSDSLVEHLKSLRGFASVNRDTVQWYFQTRLEYVKQHKERMQRWGPVGKNYLYEEPGMAAMEAKGYNPWRVYSQMMSCCYTFDDSAYAEINEEYNALLTSIK